MPYCTVADVKRAVDFPTSGAPISDADILEFIYDAEEEIEDIYKTFFGNVEDSGTADGDFSTTTFSDSSQTFTVDAYVGYVVWIYAGTGAGNYREISANDATKVTVGEAFSTTPDATSKYKITKLGYADETVDGSGNDTQFVRLQPLINLNSLDIDSVAITTTDVFQYKPAGKLVLGVDADTRFFSNNTPQLVDLKYIFGVYPLPRIIKRLCVVMAGIRTLVAQIAGTYDDFTNVTLPHINASKGEPYVNIQSAVNFLQQEAKGIVYGAEGTQLQSDFRKLPSYRPFAVFG